MARLIGIFSPVSVGMSTITPHKACKDDDDNDDGDDDDNDDDDDDDDDSGDDSGDDDDYNSSDVVDEACLSESDLASMPKVRALSPGRESSCIIITYLIFVTDTRTVSVEKKSSCGEISNFCT